MWQIRRGRRRKGGPLERRGERTAGHDRSKAEGKGKKRKRKVWVEAGSSTQMGQKGFFTIVH